MKWLSYYYQGKQNFGLLKEEHAVIPAEKLFRDPPTDLLAYIESQPELLAGALAETGIPLTEIEITVPYLPPNNVIGIGKNYPEHVLEMGSKEDIPKEILVFTKSKNALVADKGVIKTHQNVTNALDYEGELAVIIGKAGSDLSEAEAVSHIFGYTILNDVTARDLQVKHKQFYIAKSLDNSCPIGPYIATKETFPDPEAPFSIRTLVNGEERQSGTTADMIFSIPRMIADLSKGHTLMPGDIIATGTPPGVGKGFNPPRYLKDGDEVAITISGIGTLTNFVQDQQ